jgi:hypothetical protein
VLDVTLEDKQAAVFAANSQSANGTLFIAGRDGNSWSNDLGQSFQRRSLTDASIGHQPVIFPDGEVITVAVSEFPAAITAKNSLDLGNTFSNRRTVRSQNYSSFVAMDDAIPGAFRAGPFGQLRLSGNTLYFVFPDIVSSAGSERNVDILLIKSTDRGQTWSTPVVVNSDSATPRDQFMPTLAIGPDGALNISYMDTRRSDMLDSSQQAFLDVVYARSVDGGETFSETFLTDAPFEAGNIGWRAYTNDFVQSFVGDYMGIAAPSDAVYVVYPDRRAPDTNQVQLVLATVRPPVFSNGFETP